MPGSATWDIFRAVSPLTAYALSVGIGLSADHYAKAYFDNGFSADGVVSYPVKAGSEQRDEIRDYVKRKLGGNNRFSGPLVLDQGGTFAQLQINAADAQLINARRFNAIDIARIFRVPPHLINEFDKANAFGKGLEEMTQQFLDYTLGPHLKAIEDEVNFKLYPGHGNRRCKFDRDGFIRRRSEIPRRGVADPRRWRAGAGHHHAERGADRAGAIKAPGHRIRQAARMGRVAAAEGRRAAGRRGETAGPARAIAEETQGR